jgi:hypothetical protein
VFHDFAECALHAAGIRYVAFMGCCAAASGSDLLRGFGCRFSLKIQNVDEGSLSCKEFRDGTANSVGAAGDYGGFFVEAENLRIRRIGAQRETPLFQGMKSS